MYQYTIRRIFIFIGILTILTGALLMYFLRDTEVRQYEIAIRRLRTYIFRYDTIVVDSAWVRTDYDTLVLETYIKFDVTDVYGNRHEDIVSLTYAGGENDKVLDLIRPGDDNYEDVLFPIETDTIVPKWEIDHYYAPPAMTGYIIVANGVCILVLAIIFKPTFRSNYSKITLYNKQKVDVIAELREAKQLFDEGKISRVEFARRKNELL